MGKSQAQIRLKTLMWPFVVLWITALLGFAQQLPYVMVAVLCWCGAAVQVHGYEQKKKNEDSRPKQIAASVSRASASTQMVPTSTQVPQKTRLECFRVGTHSTRSASTSGYNTKRGALCVDKLPMVSTECSKSYCSHSLMHSVWNV